MNTSNYLLLKKSPFFTSIPDSILSSLAQQVSLRQFKAGEFLIKEGDFPKGCYYVLSGEMIAYTLNNEAGAKCVVGRMGAHHLIGELSVISGERALCSVEAIGNVESIFLNTNVFVNLLETEPLVSQKLLPIVVKRFHQFWAQRAT